MITTHNNMDRAIAEMETAFSKGQPFAKRNKERKVRAILRDMRESQAVPPSIGEVWFYLKMWAASKVGRAWRWVLGKCAKGGV